MQQIAHQRTWKPDRLAYWYFRLNGFLTIENFVIHPDRGPNQGTDADLLAVRFAHRAENLQRPMLDDPEIASCATLANVVIAEVKTGLCALNGPWTKHPVNMERVLKAIGCVAEDAIEMAREALQQRGIWSDPDVTIRMLAVGERTSAIVRVQQITWSKIIDFCIQRFKEYQREKSSNEQWSKDGKELRALSLRHDRNGIRRAFRLNIPVHP